MPCILNFQASLLNFHSQFHILKDSVLSQSFLLLGYFLVCMINFTEVLQKKRKISGHFRRVNEFQRTKRRMFQPDVLWITYTERCKFIRNYKWIIFLYILICINFRRNTKITSSYIHNKYLLYILHLDVVGSEAVAVCVRSALSKELGDLLGPFNPNHSVNLWYGLYVYIETLQNVLCTLFKTASHRLENMLLLP